MFRAIFLLCLAGIPFSQCKQLHEYMTPEEVMAVFHKPHHLVPEYDLVPVMHREVKRNIEDVKENTKELKMKVFNEDVRLYLTPTEGILANEHTPVWTALPDSQAPEGLQYKEVPKAMDYVGIPFQDVKSSSSLLVSPTPDGHMHLNGILNKTLIMKSLPERLLNNVLYGGPNLYEPHHTNNLTDDEDFAYTHHHVVYKMPLSDHHPDFNITDPEGSEDEKSNAPEIIYPEVILVADYGLYRTLGENVERVVKYLVAFLNGVDLRYRLLTTPKIRFNIAGMIIGVDKDAIPYLEDNRVEVSTLDADNALRGMADYFYRENRFPTEFYDMVIALTSLDMGNRITDDPPSYDSSTLGYAYVAGACDRNDTKKSSEAVGIVEDNGGFSGIIPTAHEIGHLIGARHDGNPKSAGDCAPHDGFIMTSGFMLHENGFEWSSCSINAFYNFINEDRAKCLYNKPETSAPITRILPGALLSLDEQCYQVSGTAACNKDATVCTRLECEYPRIKDFCRATAPAAEGSPCGDGLICLNGRCVLEGLIKDKDRKLLEKFLPKFTLQKIKKIPWLQLLKDLKDKIKDTIEDTKDKLIDTKDKIKDTIEDTKDKIIETKDKIKNTLIDKKDKIMETLKKKLFPYK
ncbi:venom metalloproteinase 3 isoform X2 [Monomorium pharaonis]|uniref:venom metalloproteinase 3 isoform X2 n=1 Tax=Monomorium pharaonis TaxID=307658 RepID=UPI0017468812|nr:venom metalloproteinase 3 isoform X2 [Monomorium pharaonis]